MENNNIDNNENKTDTTKKNNKLIIIIVIIIVLAVFAIITLKINKEKEIIPLTQSEIDLNQAITIDTTESIKTNIDNIDLTDTTDMDLESIDQELKNL